MNILGCLDTPTQCEYFLSSQSIQDMRDEDLSKIRNERIGFIFQTFHLLTRLSALENVTLPLRYSETSPEEAKQKDVYDVAKLLTEAGTAFAALLQSVAAQPNKNKNDSHLH